MIGAIAGDIIGSRFEWRPLKSIDFELFTDLSDFTDDTVLTIATAEALLTDNNFQAAYHRWGQRYPNAGYGGSFRAWLRNNNPQPYNSWGNGSAMRISPVGWAADSIRQAMQWAAASASVTHNHPEGIKGAQATAAAIYMARQGSTKDQIAKHIYQTFGYDLSRTLAHIRPGYKFDVSCQGSVPESIIAFLESTDYESAVRNAISLGGDSDTMAAIAGSIAEAFYGGIPTFIHENVLSILPDDMEEILEQFAARYRK